MEAHDDSPLRAPEELLEPFREAETPRARWRVGTEAEKFGVFIEDGAPLPFDGPKSVRRVLEALVESHGWFEQRELEGGEVISLRRGESSITLEPGGQLELSGAPLETIHHTCTEFRGHMAELSAISEELGVAWLGLGFHPTATQAALPWVPKLRYRIMRDYLPTRGALALDMMRRTATVQANFDFESEVDAMRKLRVALRTQPVVTAMFANSPFAEGARTGDRTRRGRVWLEVDPDRSGLLPFAHRDDAGYADYVGWALDVPMFMLKRGDRVLENTGQTFRAFMKDGFSGATATRGDWTTHLNTLFPEVRLKTTLEVRGADGQGTWLTCALPALWKGLLYDEAALDELDALTRSWELPALNALRREVAAKGLHAAFEGESAGHWARRVLAIASGGLSRLNHLNRDGKDERIHLTELEGLVAEDRTPADVLLDSVREDHFLEDLLKHARV
ncbi:MAG: glutamate-cysteine ligase family protein [Myxococcota bacterium]